MTSSSKLTSVNSDGWERTTSLGFAFDFTEARDVSEYNYNSFSMIAMNTCICRQGNSPRGPGLFS